MKKIIIIIAILVAGGAFWFIKSGKNTQIPSTETSSGTGMEQASDKTANSIDISAINQDVESIDVDSADQDFKDIEKDLQGL